MLAETYRIIAYYDVLVIHSRRMRSYRIGGHGEDLISTGPTGMAVYMLSLLVVVVVRKVYYYMLIANISISYANVRMQSPRHHAACILPARPSDDNSLHTHTTFTDNCKSVDIIIYAHTRARARMYVC